MACAVHSPTDATLALPHAEPSLEIQRAIRDLTEVTHADLPVVGGKGANLGEMIHVGLPVPTGFGHGAIAKRRGRWRNVVALAPVDAAVAARNHPHRGAPYGAPRFQSPNETPVARAVNTVS